MASSGTVDISQLSRVLLENVEGWEKKVDLALVDGLYEVAKATKHELVKNTATRRRKKGTPLRSSYVVTPSGKMSMGGLAKKRTLHSTEYQLAHLIEDGHKVYNRPNGKFNKAAKKEGPYEIKRTYPKSRKKAISQMPTKTSKYEMWKKAEEYAKKELYEVIVGKLKNLNKVKGV